MDRFFHKELFRNENDYVEYINMYLITALAIILYSAYAVVFTLYAYSNLLFYSQLYSILVCILAFTLNRISLSPRRATIIMIVLVSFSINIWAYSLNVGSALKWYALLALCPMYFFSSLKLPEKVFLTALVLLSFFSATLIGYYNEPIVHMNNTNLFNTISSCVIFFSVSFELVLYKYIKDQRDDELERIETILDNIRCGMIITDAETREILDINPAAAKLYNKEQSGYIGNNHYAPIYSDVKDQCLSDDSCDISGRFEQEIKTPDGKTVTVIKSVAKIWYKNRSAYLESFTDISELKEAESKLRLLEVTERSNHAKSEFLSRMSHEMRTPMNAIIGMTKIAEGTDDISRLRYCLSTIKVSSTHLLGIINDILDMSKIEAGKLELESLPLDIEKMLIKICDLLIEQTEQKNIRLKVFIGAGTQAGLIGDELRLSQVITNLMSNAVKFTPVGGEIKITADETQRGDDFRVIRFTVKDTGIGMTETQISKLFNSFEQADGSISRKFGGTGLGLAISKNIVEKMGGNILVESAPGNGSTFSLEIKLELDQDRDRTNIARETLRPDMNIIIADADSEERSYFKSIMQKYGIETDEAKNTEELSELIRLSEETGKHYDLVYIGSSRKEGDPVEAFNRLDAALSRDKIVLVTPFLTWSKIENEARAAGITKFVPKPLFPSNILKSINMIPEKNEASQEYEYPGKAKLPDFSDIVLLLAEDVEINREIFITLLEDTKITVDIAENGEEAVRKFKANRERYNMIIMDIQMPVTNGYEATRLIRSVDSDKARSIPIVAMSADAFAEDIEKCKACGMNDHLKKPIELESVIEKISVYARKNAQ